MISDCKKKIKGMSSPRIPQMIATIKLINNVRINRTPVIGHKL